MLRFTVVMAFSLIFFNSGIALAPNIYLGKDAVFLEKILERAEPLDLDYQAQFKRCDEFNQFRHIKLPWSNNKGKKLYYPCSRDKNRVKKMLRIRKTETSPETIIFTSKLGVDLDGSWFACNTPGYTDLCGTSLSFPDPQRKLCPGRNPKNDPRRCPVDSDRVNYVVIPVRGPTKKLGREFRDKTGIRMGDYGVVVKNGEVIPIIVADGGPFNKLGEGSVALHRQLKRELCVRRDAGGNCTKIKKPLGSIAGNITTVIFPRSGDRRQLTSRNIERTLKKRATFLWHELQESHGVK